MHVDAYTKIQICKYRYASTDTQIHIGRQIPRRRYRNADAKIQSRIQRRRHVYAGIYWQIQRHKYRNTETQMQRCKAVDL